ncbi:MAG TPA: aldehyde dehydrogenase family protein [Candidatus Baltobacteraceae bacterium]|nr:aldehyde dehydrogenase family protein [Candidatus Baltobacteraceae bacterium]
MPKIREPLRLDVRKTYKLYVNGEFVRSESGRSDVAGAGTEDSANVARASRKDLRDAVVAARAAWPRWAGATPMNRGLVLYRLAEMMDARRAQFVERLRFGIKLDEPSAIRETTTAIDRVLWYAGWCDKYAALLSARNPVAGPYYNYSTPEPMGVVGVIAPDEPSLLGVVSAVVPPLVSGNTVVALASELDPRTAIVFAECLATCDLPAGAVNVLTGRRIEVAPHLARHMDVNALEAFSLDGPFAAELERLASDNLKRCRMIPALSPAEWFAPEAQDLANVAAFTETKTIWHPSAI